MRRITPMWSAVLLAFIVTPCFANKVHAPLPQKILTAKNVYIENHAMASLGDGVYKELNKWGRFEVVTDREKADLVFGLSIDGGETATGTTSVYHPPDDKNWGGTWSNGTSTSTTRGFSNLTVLDPKTGEVLYSDRKPWGLFHGAIEATIKELRKRIEEQEKGSKGK